MARPKVVFVGDTVLGSRHFGCQLVCETFREQFERVGLDLLRSYLMDPGAEGTWERAVEGADLVVINGEGSFHHGRFLELMRLAELKPAVLVNTVWEENPEDVGLENFRLIAAREWRSAAAVREDGAECLVVPDALFASKTLGGYAVPTNRRGVGRTDSAVKEEVGIGPIKWRTRRGFSPKVEKPEDYLSRLCRYERLCIGRFHAAIAASVMGIPFATWESNTWKLRGLMEDMEVKHLHFDDPAAALAGVPEEMDPLITTFATEARMRVEAMFDEIAKVAGGTS